MAPTNLLPPITAPEELRRDVMTTRELFRGAAETASAHWVSHKHVLLTALIAGVVARYIGRPVAKFENTIIGGIAAGFSAYRDPRDKLWKQLLVALGYGATWGLTDVYVPIVLNYFSQAGEQSTAPELVQSAAVANEGDGVGRYFPAPRRGRVTWRRRR